MDRRHIEYLRRFMRERASVVVNEERAHIVTSRLERVAKARDASMDEVFADLQTQRPSCIDQVVDALTTHETSFFRDPHVFDTVGRELLPRIIAAKGRVRQVEIWCAAASTGQEPYSLAMLVADRYPELLHRAARILATDVSKQAVEHAARAVYSAQEMNRGLNTQRRERHFERHDEGFLVRPALRSIVRVETLNLAGPWPRMPRFDLVLLRNVLIYLDADARRDVLERMAKQMARHGFLLMGAAEQPPDDLFERVRFGRTSVFQPRG